MGLWQSNCHHRRRSTRETRSGYEHETAGLLPPMAGEGETAEKTRGDRHNTAEYNGAEPAERNEMKLYCGCNSPAERRKRACKDEGEEA